MENNFSAPPCYTDLPVYTPDAAPNEVVSCVAGPSTSGPFQEYEYKNGNLKLNLGRKRNGLFRPAYGWNGTMEGFVQVKKNLKNVQSIIVSIEGYMTTGVSERGFLTELTKTRVLHMTQTLVDLTSSGPPVQIGGMRYGFSFALPSYMTGGTEPLPPTFSALHPGISGDVTYYVEVNMIRKGLLRQNEKVKGFFYYLPRTYAPSLPMTSDLGKSGGNLSGWHVSAVLPKLPVGAAATSGSNLCVSVAFPRGLQYSVGSAVPFCLTVASDPTTGALPILFSCLSVQLVRVTTIKVGGRRSSCETLIAGGEVFRVEERGDVRTMFGSVKCEREAESSWAVAEIAVKHIVRVRLAPRRDSPSLTCSLPTYEHEQTVLMRTREQGWGAEDERQPELALAPRRPGTA